MANDIFPGASLVQLLEWGYPMGSLRPTPPTSLAFSVIHITANVASAQNEAAWRLNDPALQNSATFFVNQDGSVVQCLGDPLHMDPWTNGDLQNPDTSNPRIAALGGVNPNERSLLTIENIGREPAMPITAAQEATDAALIAYYHAKAGLPVSRETVIGHYQINSVNRANCPSTNKSVIDRIVALAAGQGGDVQKGTFIEGIYNRRTSTLGPTQFLADPTDNSGGVLAQFAAGRVFDPAFAVAGVTLSGSNRWYGGWGQTAKGLEFGYLHGSALGPMVPHETVGGITQAQLDAAVAKAAMAAKVAAAKAGATGAAKAASDFAASLP